MIGPIFLNTALQPGLSVCWQTPKIFNFVTFLNYYFLNEIHVGQVIKHETFYNSIPRRIIEVIK